MKIIGLSRWISSDSKDLVFQMIMSENLGSANYSMNVLVEGKNKNGELVSKVVSTGFHKVSGDELEGSVALGNLAVSDLSQSLEIGSGTISKISFIEDGQTVDEVELDEPTKLLEVKAPEVELTQEDFKLWSHYQGSQGRRKLWTTSGFIDLTSAIRASVTTSDYWTTPGINNPEIIEMDAWQKKLNSPIGVSQDSGKVHLVKVDDETVKLGRVFINESRVYGELVDLNPAILVTNLALGVGLEKTTSTTVQMIKDPTLPSYTASTSQPTLVDDSGTQFSVAIQSLLATYKHDIIVHRPALFKADYTGKNVLIGELGAALPSDFLRNADEEYNG